MKPTTFARGALALAFLVTSYFGLALNPNDSSSVAEIFSEKPANKRKIGSLRTFESLRSSEQFFEFDEDVFSVAAYEDTTITATISAFRDRAVSLFDKVEKAQRFVDFLDETSLLELPVGIKKTTGNIEYSILIDSMKLTPTHAELTAYMVFTLPSNGKTIAFRGSGIKFSKKGGIEPEAKLQLLGDYPIPFNEKTMLVLKGDGQTFVDFDCDGFKSIGLEAEVLFSRDVFLPDTPSGEPGTGRVQSRFSTVLTNWSDFLVELSIPDFQVNGLDGVGFSINGAVFDFSDLRNSAATKFPTNYSVNGLDANSPLWRGFYFRDVVVALPPQFNKRSAGVRTTFSGKDLIIDKNGFTGQVEATDLIQRSDGDMNGWAFSLSRVRLDFQASQLTAGGLEGDVVIPISKGDRAFDYTALIYPGNEYVFSVATPDSIEFDLFKTSEVELFPNSSLEIKVADNKFLPKANLFGTMNIAAPLGKEGVSLASIAFENLQVQTVKPFLKADYFSFGSEAAEQAMSGFPIQINNIGFRSISDTQSALEFDLLLNVTEEFSGETGLSLIGKIKSGDRPKWKFEKVQVRSIALDIQTAGFDFKGSLDLYRNDAVYGDGFNGKVDANFKKVGVRVAATAIFGNVDGYRYWYVDVAAGLGGDSPVQPGFYLKSIAGGAFYHMRMDDQGVGSKLGETNSGMVYVPDKENGLGLKASVEFGVIGDNVFNGDAAFEMAFFEGGGLRYISVKGNGYFMTPPANASIEKIRANAQKLGKVIAKLEKAAEGAGAGLLCQSNEQDPNIEEIYGKIQGSGEKGAVSAHVYIEMDFENNELHGNFEVYMKVAGGIIEGIGENGRAGWAALHFSKDDWYIYIGTPDDRIGISVGVGPIRAEANGYFMVGSTLPGSPPPPKEVSDIVGDIDLDYMSELNELSNGGGFGFGAAFKVDTGDLSFLMFYAHFKAGAGFDIMLKDYGSATCAGSDKPIGINGWYANGQAYAYFDGKIGIRIKIFGRRKSVEILSIGAAAVLQAKLPNPFWMRGTVGGRFSVLGGLVKGRCAFQVTIGKECEIQGGSVLEGVEVIADISPGDGESEVSVFTTPQAVFNLPVGKEFEMVDTDEKKKKFRIKLDHFDVVDANNVIAGKQDWNSEQTVLAFNAHDVLPPQKKLVVKVQVSFEEQRGAEWVAVVVDNRKYVESREISFESGNAPDYIPTSNIEYSYPLVNQLNYYKDESVQGYIKLKKGQPYLFDLGSEWSQQGRVTSSAQQAESFELNYIASAKEVRFQLPDLNLDQIVDFELLNVPTQSTGEVDRNVKLDSSRVIAKGGAKLVARAAEGSIAELQEKQIYTSNFRTSKYPTFESKIKAQVISRTSMEILFLWEGLYSNSTIQSDEAFSKEELVGNTFTKFKPTVRLEADLANNNYYEEEIFPLVYDSYPIDGNIRINHRNVDSLGIVPTKAVRIRQNNRSLTLTEEHILSGNYQPTDQGMMFQYFLPPVMYFDFKDIQSQVVNRYISHSTVSSRVEKLIWGQFPLQPSGQYNILAQYYLPGRNEPNSEVLVPTTLKLE